MAFASKSLSLAILEVLVHLQRSSILASYVAFKMEFPKELVQEVDLTTLPRNWRNSPAPPQTKEIGDAWVKGGSGVLLRVPSVIVVHECNYLINPMHPELRKLTIEDPVPFDVDSRAFGGGVT